MNCARRRIAALLAIATAAGACATTPPRHVRPAPVNVIAFDRASESAAIQTRRCYRAPRVDSAARRIATRLRIRITPDGALGGLPEIVWQAGVDDANRPYAGRMAEAAIESVVRCAPFTLPQELTRAPWVEFDLTFSPAVAV
jgi:hypothetical protein